jgi:hypothetical protein
VEPELRQVPPSSLELTFKVNEGPKVKVGEITFDGNNHFKPAWWSRRSMKNLHGIGIPYSIFFEDLFCQDLRFHQARRRPGAHSGLLPETTATLRPTPPGTSVKIVDVGRREIPPAAHQAEQSRQRTPTSTSPSRKAACIT